MPDVLSGALRTLEAFDAASWDAQLSTAQEQTEHALSLWEQTDRARYSEEGQALERERITAPEAQARQRALAAADAALVEVARAKALLITHTGLGAAEMADAEARRWQFQEDAATLAPADLAQLIAASAALADKSACFLWVRYATTRLQSLQQELEAAGDNPASRARARASVLALRPAIDQAKAQLESPQAAELRQTIATQERAAEQLKARAQLAPRSVLFAQKRRGMAGGI